MRHWSLLGTRNWQAKPLRTAGAILAIALGTGSVVWVTCCYESVRRTLLDWSADYIGQSHIYIESPLGKYGQIAERIALPLRDIKGVRSVTGRLVQRLRVQPVTPAELERRPSAERRWNDDTPQSDLHGIDLQYEFDFRDYDRKIVAGRMLAETDDFACVLERTFAEESGVGVGDLLLVWSDIRPDPYELHIVGLVERRRIAKFQKGLALLRLPILQQITAKGGLVTSVDIRLPEASGEAVMAIAPQIQQVVRTRAGNARVYSAAARLRQLESAHNQMDFVLVLLSCVAMLTALFIILTTLSMGMVERIAHLGLLRCIGMTGWQLACTVLIEVVPLGVIGILAGIPIGLALTAVTAELVPEYVGRFPASWADLRAAFETGMAPGFVALWEALRRTGIVIAAGAGMLTTLVGAMLPAGAALTVSPLQASRPRARQARQTITVVVVVALGGVTLLFQWWVLKHLGRSPNFLTSSAWAVVLLYAGYAMGAPFVVWLVGRPALWLASAAMRVRPQLLEDQVGKAVFRSAGICCGLMVGLSLIVGLVVFSESFRVGWEFPKQFPEAYVWTFEPMRADAKEVAEGVPGVKEATAANSINVIIEEMPLFAPQVYKSVTWFMGMETDSFLDLVKAEFIEGNKEEARALLKQGGYVLVAEDFMRARNKHKGDTVKVFMDRYPVHEFTIAGVVQSPALDIAANYFQATSEMHVAAHGSVMGTNDDLKRLYNLNATKLVLLNFDLPEKPVPADWPPTGAAGANLPDWVRDQSSPIERRWRRFRQEDVLREVRRRLAAPRAFSGTVAELKGQIDNELATMTKLLTAVPLVALVVAAVGVANLMSANVASRVRQLAILRAVGATRGLILRMVVGEALVLGLLGSALGFVLGMHLAANTGELTERMWGYEVPFTVPWGYVTAAVALTVGLCIVAGVLPARHASRTNVVDALHVV